MNASREYIELYLSHGLTPIPLRRNSKAPKVEKWPSLPRDFLIEGFEDGDNVGIRIERPLFIVDVDDRRLAPLILDEFNSRTWIVETRRGVHFYFAAPKGHYPETNKRGRLIQLLAEGCQVVAPPSRVDGHEYRFLCDPEEAAIAEVGEDKLMLLEAIVEAVARHEQLILRFAEAWDEGHRHNISLWLNGYLRKSRVPRLEAAVVVKSICLLANDSELKDRLRALDDTYRKPLDQVKGISGLIEELASIVGHDRLREFLEVLPGIERSEAPFLEGQAADKPAEKYLVGGEILGGLLLEVVNHDSGPKILVYDPAKNTLEVVDAFIHGGARYRPYPDLPYLEYLPGVPEAISEDHGLWRETLEFIKEYYDNPRSDDVYHVMTACIGWSYLCDVVRASTPYLCFLGPWRSGKTRALEVMASLCYKPMLIVDPSEASIFRLIEKLKPTLFIDEAQILDKNVRAIMASGYRYGVKVPRVIDPESDDLDSIKWFDVFGFKTYACREEPPSDILSRSIVIHCEKNIRPTRKNIDRVRATGLRTRWLAQKLRMHGKVNVIFEEFQSDDGRVQEMVSPLLVMAQTFGGPDAAEAITRYGRLVEREIQSLEATSDDALIVEKIMEIAASHEHDSPEYITNRQLVEALNEVLPKPVYTPEYIGMRMSALGFERMRLHGGKTAYKIDYDLLGRLAKRYNISLSLDVVKACYM